MNFSLPRLPLKSVALALWIVCTSHSLLAQSTKQLPPDIRQQQLLESFMEKRVALMDEQNALKKSGATTVQVSLWRKTNAPRFEELEQLGREMSTLSTEGSGRIASRRIPSDATPELRAFFQKQADVAERWSLAKTTETKIGASGNPPEVAMSSEMKNELRTLEQKAKEAAVKNPRSSAGAPVRVPTDASAELKAIFIERRQLTKDLQALEDRYRSAAPEVRDAALLQWQKKNKFRIQRLQLPPQSLASQPKS